MDWRFYRKAALLSSGASAGFLAVFLFFVAVVTASGTYIGTDAHRLLDQAYQSVSATHTLPRTKAEAAAEIRNVHTEIHVRYGGTRSQGYDWVKSHKEAVYIEELTPKHIILIGHESDPNIVAETGDAQGNTDATLLWSGSMDWSLIRWAAEIEGGLLVLLLAALLGRDGLSVVKRQRLERRKARKLLAQWQEYVGTSGLLGPQAPRLGYKLHVAELEEHASGPDQATFSPALYEWRGGWKRQPQVVAPKLAPVSVPRTLALNEVSEAWFDFCKRVTDHNTETWDAIKRLEGERQKLGVKQQKGNELEAMGLKEILTPGHQMAHSLAEPPRS